MKGSETNLSKSNSAVKLKRGINLFTGCAIIVGNIVGSGIFITSKGVLEKSGSPGLALVIWVLSGLISLIGAYCYTELGTLIQTSGGDYAYINESYGPLMSFLYIYMMVFVTFPCINAIFGITVAVYIVRLFFVDCAAPDFLIKLISALTISIVCVINLFNVNIVSKVQSAFTVAKIAALLMIIVIGFYNFFSGPGSITEVTTSWFVDYPVNYQGLSMAFYNGLFSYSGWNCLNFLTEEMKNPRRNLPMALLMSIPFITLIYLVTNIAYFLVLSPNEVLMSEAVALTFSDKTMGNFSFLTPFFIAFSTFGALSGMLLSASRVFYAAARDGNLPQCFAIISVKSFTPITCIVLQTIISLLMLLVKDLDTLILYSTFSEILFIAIALSSIFYFRYKRPDAERPIKVNLIFPIIFSIVCLFLIILTFQQNPTESIIGMAILLMGVPLYCIGVLWKNKPESLNKFMDNTTIFCQKMFMSVKED